MKKKYFIFIFLILVITMISGCGINNNSSKAVANSMIERLIKNDYEDIDKLLLTDSGTYIDEISFKKYLVNKEINLSGVKDYEIVEIIPGVEEKNEQVVVKIDDSKYFKIDTQKEASNWFVKLSESDYDSNLKIEIPKGASVKLNNNKLDFKKYGKTAQSTVYPGYYGSIELEISTDVYNISRLLKNDYKLTVEFKDGKTLNTTINSDKNYFDYNSENYEPEKFSENDDTYSISSLSVDDKLEKKIDNFLNSFYEDLFKSINSNSDFSTLKKYFDSDYIKEATKKYGESISDKIPYNNVYYKSIYSDFKFKDIEPLKDYGYVILSGNNILAYIDYSYSAYYEKYVYSSEPTLEDYKDYQEGTLIQLKKKDNNFVIVSETNMFPADY